MKKQKRLEMILLAAALFVILWLMISYVEIVGANSYPNPVYSPWNAFTLGIFTR